jgi:hypothetical protein
LLLGIFHHCLPTLSGHGIAGNKNLSIENGLMEEYQKGNEENYDCCRMLEAFGNDWGILLWRMLRGAFFLGRLCHWFDGLVGELLCVKIGEKTDITKQSQREGKIGRSGVVHLHVEAACTATILRIGCRNPRQREKSISEIELVGPKEVPQNAI